MLKSWNELPDFMKNEDVNQYYNILRKKKGPLLIKRLFDIIVSIVLLIVLLPVFLFFSIIIPIDSKGKIFFRQVRITQYGKDFRIFKFRTMVNDAEKLGTSVTTNNDTRVTKVGKFIRKYRIDEIPQLLNVITGGMTFVGTRPEVRKYVDAYSDDMLATLLLPAGITSMASIEYKDEERLLSATENVDETYVRRVLPEKMKYNLNYMKDFSFINDIKIMIKTAIVVMK